MLDKNPYTRITMEELAKNEWVNDGIRSLTNELGIEAEISQFYFGPPIYSLYTVISVVYIITKLKRLMRKRMNNSRS